MTMATTKSTARVKLSSKGKGIHIVCLYMHKRTCLFVTITASLALRQASRAMQHSLMQNDLMVCEGVLSFETGPRLDIQKRLHALHDAC